MHVELPPRRREAVAVPRGRRGARRSGGQVCPGHGGGIVGVEVVDVLCEKSVCETPLSILSCDASRLQALQKLLVSVYKPSAAYRSLTPSAEGIRRGGCVGGEGPPPRRSQIEAYRLQNYPRTTTCTPLLPPTLASLAPRPFPRVPSPASWHHRPSQPVRPGPPGLSAAKLASFRCLTVITRAY